MYAWNEACRGRSLLKSLFGRLDPEMNWCGEEERMARKL